MRCPLFIFLLGMLVFAEKPVEPGKQDFAILFDASGQATIGAHVFGKNRFAELAPGYRADFLIYTDFFSYRNLVFDFLAGATTSIARLPEYPIKMDKIKYVLAPSFRYPFRKTLARIELFHECIHTISREERSGSIWWNVVKAGGGTKGAYHYYLVEKYNRREFSLRNSFDFRYDIGWYLHGKAPLIGSNHDYLVDGSGLFRYHFGLFRNQTVYMDIANQIWVERDGEVSSKTTVEVNWVILAVHNIATIFYGYCVQDDNPFDNEANLMTLGFRSVF